MSNHNNYNHHHHQNQKNSCLIVRQNCTSKSLKEINQIVKKTLIYSRQKNEEKILKYLLLSKNFKYGEPFIVEKCLRRAGALQAISHIISNITNLTSNTQSSRTKIQNEIIINGLAILANSYAVDYKSRYEASKTKFFLALRSIFSNETNQEILSKAVKCLANLSKESESRSELIRCGMIEILISSLVKYSFSTDNNSEKSDKDKDNGTESETTSSFSSSSSTTVSTSSSTQSSTNILNSTAGDNVELIKNILRGIRIITYDHDSRSLAIRNKGFNVISEFYSSRENLDSKLTIEVLMALSSITEKLRKYPTELINLKDSSIISKLINNIEREDNKIVQLSIKIIKNLGKNSELSEILGNNSLFDKCLLVLQKTLDKNLIEQILDLIHFLTKLDNSNCYKLSRCSSSQLIIFLNILKTKENKDFHLTVLNFIEILFESALKSLLSNGLLEVLYNILLEEGGYVDFETLRKSLESYDEKKDVCPVHVTDCQFRPIICSYSPTYQKIEEEVKEFVKMRSEIMNISVNDSSRCLDYNSSSGYEESSTSPYSSSCYSPTSSNVSSISSPEYNCNYDNYDGPMSPLENEKNMDLDIEISSSTCIIKDLEERASQPFDLINTEIKELENQHLINKRKVDTLEDGEVKEEGDSNNNNNDNDDEKVTEENNKRRKIDVSIRKTSEDSAKKITSVLTTITRCIYHDPFPQELVKLTPILITIILNGKINNETERKNEESEGNKADEILKLWNRCFISSYTILNVMFSKIENFEYFIKNEVFSSLFRIFFPFEESDKIFKDYGSILLSSLRGEKNQSLGWREGYFSKRIIVGEEEENTKMKLLLPLFYHKKFSPSRRSYIIGSLEKIFDLICDADNLEYKIFQDCIIALTALAETFGMKWKLNNSRYNFNNNNNRIENINDGLMNEVHDQNEEEEQIIFELDNASRIIVKKSQIISFPVFSAMFDGHFLEAGKQKVKIQNCSYKALRALLSYINRPSELPLSLDLEILFELLSLTDQFLLDALKETTINNIISQICPFSVPKIYERAVKDGGKILNKPIDEDFANLTFLTLKYILVGQELSLGNKCSAFYKIFDLVENPIVVGDLRSLFEFYANKFKIF